MKKKKNHLFFISQVTERKEEEKEVQLKGYLFSWFIIDSLKQKEKQHKQKQINKINFSNTE